MIELRSNMVDVVIIRETSVADEWRYRGCVWSRITGDAQRIPAATAVRSHWNRRTPR